MGRTIASTSAAARRRAGATTTLVHRGDVLGHDRVEQALPRPEVVADRRVVGLAGVPDHVAHPGPGDPVAGEALLTGTEEPGPGEGCIARHKTAD